MIAAFDQLLSRYESGALSRRELVGRLAAMTVVSQPEAAAEPVVGRVTQLNHVTVFVSDVRKSVAFYQRLFGMPVLSPQDEGINLRAGAGFLGIYPSGGRAPGINHVCLGLEHFDAETARRRLKGAGVEASIRLRGETKELYFTDADDVRVQLQDVRYVGGTGPLGDRLPK